MEIQALLYSCAFWENRTNIESVPQKMTLTSYSETSKKVSRFYIFFQKSIICKIKLFPLNFCQNSESEIVIVLLPL